MRNILYLPAILLLSACHAMPSGYTYHPDVYKAPPEHQHSIPCEGTCND